jgi:hypothetical protein
MFVPSNLDIHRHPGKRKGYPVTDSESLPPMESARQLADPEGAIGIDVGFRLNKINGRIADCAYIRLELAPNMDVLQIGFGNGHLLPDLLGRAKGLKLCQDRYFPNDDR